VRVLREPEREHGNAAGERSGREYLLARVDEPRRAQLASRELHTPLAALANASVVREHPRPPAILVAAYLVDARRVQEFCRRASELGAHQENLQVVVTGPLPPYTFAAEECDED
jgi:Gas vesicle synthesis protein GvpL/GvpF